MQGCPLGLRWAARQPARSRGPEVLGKRLPAAPGWREGRDAARPAHPAAASPGHPSPPGVYSMLLVTRSRHAGSSCLAPLPPFVSFCFLRPETEHLMEKACSPALCGDTRFLPPQPGTAPAAVPAAAPLASGWPSAAMGGQEGLVQGHGRDRPLSQQDPSGCCAQGRAVVSSRWGSAGTIEAPPGHRSPQPVQPDGYLAAHPAPSMSPMLVLSPARTGYAPLCASSEPRQAPLCFQITRFCFPPHPNPANMVVRHQPLSTLEGWLHFVLYCKGDTWSHQDASLHPSSWLWEGLVLQSHAVHTEQPGAVPTALPARPRGQRELAGMCFQARNALRVCKEKASYF